MILRIVIVMTLIIVGLIELVVLSCMGYLDNPDFVTYMLVYTILFDITCGFSLIIPSFKMKGE